MEERAVEKGPIMKLEWIIYWTGLVFVSISLYTGSKTTFVIEFGLQLIGFIIQTITKKKDKKAYENLRGLTD